jgi:hypothetical protein
VTDADAGRWIERNCVKRSFDRVFHPWEAYATAVPSLPGLSLSNSVFKCAQAASHPVSVHFIQKDDPDQIGVAVAAFDPR